MDHLPLSCNAVLVDAIFIPLLVPAWSPDDFEDFKGYPSRHGWQVDLSSNPIQFKKSGMFPDAKDLAAMLQGWLYFGLLSTITNQPFNIQDFTTTNSEGHTVLTSKCLEPLVILWTESIISQPWSEDEEVFRKWHRRLRSFFITTRDILIRTKQADQVAYEHFPAVAMSIIALGEYLESALYDLFRVRHWDPPADLDWRIRDPADCGEILRDHMLQRGWCPFKIAGLDSRIMSVSALWFFANMDPPRANDHLRDESRDCCNASTCKVMDIAKSGYVIAHQTERCSCDMVGPEQAHLATALREGTIPVILLQAVETAQRQSRISCGVEAYDDGTEYVAISHVWADGHGNPHDNALPSCFLEKLVELVELLPNAKQESGVKVWLDTLCVPRGDLKQLALSRLKEPYMWAKHVLVLDSYLCSLTSACMSPLEVVARIRTSSWTQRLWTFKEGRLSGEHLWFQFQDQAINLFDLIQNVWRKEWSFLPTIAENAIHTSVLYNYTSSKIWDFEDMYWALDDITTLRGELVARTSSHSEDEGICLANIMELDIGPILRAPIQDRMKVFWSLQHRVPLGMALSSAKQKLTCPGYRWAPASLMGDSGTPHWSGPLDGNEVDAEPTSAGLLVDMFAYSIYPVEHDYQTFLRPEDSKTQGIRILQGENENLLWWMVRDKMANWYRCLLQGDWHQNQAPIDPEKDFAILVMEEIQPRAHRAAEQVGHLSFTKGIVVSYTAPADKCQPILAKAHRHVEVKQLAPSDSKLQEQLWTTALQIMTSVIKTGGHLSPDFRTIFQSTRKDALSQLVADSEFLHLSKRVNATWGGDFDGEELVGHLEWEIYRFMMCSSWIGIRMVSEKSTWCID